MAEKHYIANVGIDWLDPKTGENRRIEVDESADGVLDKSRGWLLEQGHIEECNADGSRKKKVD